MERTWRLWLLPRGWGLHIIHIYVCVCGKYSSWNCGIIVEWFGAHTYFGNGCGAVEIGGIGKGGSKASFESGGLFRDDVGWERGRVEDRRTLSYESVNQTRLGMPKERQKLTSTKAGRRNLWSKTPTFPTKHQLDNWSTKRLKQRLGIVENGRGHYWCCNGAPNTGEEGSPFSTTNCR